MQWLNEPAQWSQTGHQISLTTNSKTDKTIQNSKFKIQNKKILKTLVVGYKPKKYGIFFQAHG